MNVQTMDAARVLVATDPAIRSGLPTAELYGWYGSAAVPMYLPSVEKLTKKSIN